MCATLTGLRHITDPFRRRAPSQPRRILVIKLAEQGAWVVAWSALMDAVELVGRDNVFVMTFSENRFVLDQLDVVVPDNIIEVRASGPLITAVDLIRAVRRARAERIDASVDLEFFARSSAILGFLSGASRRVGFHRSAKEASYRGNLLTHRLSFNQRLHVGETFRLLVAALGENPRSLPAVEPHDLTAEAPPVIATTATERSEIRSIVASRTGSGDPAALVVLNANAGDLLPLRKWPEERYVELARQLLDRYDKLTVVFTGAPAEAAAANHLAAQVGSKRAVSLGGATTMRQLLVLYSLAEVLVTNDSGPAHYAALTPIDIVTLFGPESPRVFGSLSPRNHAMWAELPCSPCVNAYNDRISSCRDNKCMQRLSVDRVFDAVCNTLDARTRAGTIVPSDEPTSPP